MRRLTGEGYLFRAIGFDSGVETDAAHSVPLLSQGYTCCVNSSDACVGHAIVIALRAAVQMVAVDFFRMAIQHLSLHHGMLREMGYLLPVHSQARTNVNCF